MFIGFVSDNASGAHPRILEALQRANTGYCMPYGDDEYCERAKAEFRKLFGDNIEVFFALSGTGCNVLSLRSALRPWQSVICSDAAHINTAESGAPEWTAGVKLLAVPSVNGKISPDSLDRYFPYITDCHHPTPHLVSITQTTEKGAVYSPEEVRALFAANGLPLL